MPTLLLKKAIRDIQEEKKSFKDVKKEFNQKERTNPEKRQP